MQGRPTAESASADDRYVDFSRHELSGGHLISGRLRRQDIATIFSRYIKVRIGPKHSKLLSAKA
jgi:hypothetical protein